MKDTIMKIIHTYTRRQAVADGLQINIDSLNGGLSIREDAGVINPVFITNRVYNLIKESLPHGLNDFNGVLWDIIWMFKISAINNENYFSAYIYFDGKPKLFDFKAECGALDIDDPRPTITIDIR